MTSFLLPVPPELEVAAAQLANKQRVFFVFHGSERLIDFIKLFKTNNSLKLVFDGQRR